MSLAVHTVGNYKIFYTIPSEASVICCNFFNNFLYDQEWYKISVLRLWTLIAFYCLQLWIYLSFNSVSEMETFIISSRILHWANVIFQQWQHIKLLQNFYYCCHYTIIMEVPTLVNQFMDLCFTVTSALLAARHIWILPMNQFAGMLDGIILHCVGICLWFVSSG
jgi:hypothetical protein